VPGGHDGSAVLGNGTQLAEALALEVLVADCQHSIHDENLGVQVRGDSEGQPHVHAAGVPLDRGVEERRDTGEIDDGIKLSLHLGSGHAKDRAVQENVLATGEFGVETGADFEQRAHPSVDLDATGGGCGNAAEHFQ
jgi:hypothetical protein